MYRLLLLGILFCISCQTNTKNDSNLMLNIENPLPKCPDSPNCFRTYFKVSSDSSSVFSAIVTSLEQMKATTFSQNDNKMDAIFTIPVFGWEDDVTILVESSNVESTIFIRSASRVGYHDLWANTIRVKKLIKLIKQNLSI